MEINLAGFAFACQCSLLFTEFLNTRSCKKYLVSIKAYLQGIEMHDVLALIQSDVDVFPLPVSIFMLKHLLDRQIIAHA